MSGDWDYWLGCLAMMRLMLTKLSAITPEADPALHPGVALVSATMESVPSLDHADATLGTGAPFLAVNADRPVVLQPGFPLRRKTATLDQSGWHDSGQGPGSTEGSYINWLPFTDNAKSVVEDVIRIRHHPLVPNDFPIYGYIYDVKSGILVEVPEATTAGKAS